MALDIAIVVSPCAVPVGVLNVALFVVINGLMSTFPVELIKKLHKILAVVPFLYSAGGAILLSLIHI